MGHRLNFFFLISWIFLGQTMFLLVVRIVFRSTKSIESSRSNFYTVQFKIKNKVHIKSTIIWFCFLLLENTLTTPGYIFTFNKTLIRPVTQDDKLSSLQLIIMIKSKQVVQFSYKEESISLKCKFSQRSNHTL